MVLVFSMSMRGTAAREIQFSERIETPFGPALASVEAAGGLSSLLLTPEAAQYERAGSSQPSGAAAATLCSLRGQLDEYFGGRRREFSLPLAARGTQFQQRVWAELLRIPWGQTISYGELARRLGDPKCIRAAGRANGANPVWIVIPCHRVIGADGSLTGYGGGIEVKRRLLELEGALLAL